MTTFLNQLNDACDAAFAACGFDTKFAKVRPSDRPELADFQCNGALPVAKIGKRNPMDVAAEVAAKLSDNPMFEIDIAKPGFLNFKITTAAMGNHIAALKADPRQFFPKADTAQTFLVDYGGPNLAKEMHVGHLRSSIIGQALKDVLRFAGHNATGDIHMGDWGLQMGQVICFVEDNHPELLADGNTTPIEMSQLQAWYPQASALSKSDDTFRERAQRATQQLQVKHPAYFGLWERIRDASVASLKRDYDWLGVNFEHWYGESRYQDALGPIVSDLEASGVAEMSDGALIVRTSENGKIPPLILRNARGGYGYGSTDLATIAERVEDADLNTILYVVDARQSLHFKQVFVAAEKAGLLDKATVEHTAFGTVNGPDGKPFKTRDGGMLRMVDLIQLMIEAVRKRLDAAGTVAEDKRAAVSEQIARAALRFGELSHDREKDYIFNVDLFAQFEGKTGPYIQYTCVRIKTLLANAAADDLTPGDITTVGDGGRALTLALDAFAPAIERSVTARKPSFLANHAFRLADATNSYYQKNRVLSAGVDRADAASHLTVLKTAQAQLELCLDLLGIDVPDQM